MPSNTVHAHFANAAPAVRAAYDAVLRAARTLGPVGEEPKRTSIHLVSGTAFAGVAVRRESLILTLKSTDRIASPRIHKAEQASANRWHLEIRVHTPRDVDRELKAWLAASYAMSQKGARPAKATARKATPTSPTRRGRRQT